MVGQKIKDDVLWWEMLNICCNNTYIWKTAKKRVLFDKVKRRREKDNVSSIRWWFRVFVHPSIPFTLLWMILWLLFFFRNQTETSRSDKAVQRDWLNLDPSIVQLVRQRCLWKWWMSFWRLEQSLSHWGYICYRGHKMNPRNGTYPDLD